MALGAWGRAEFGHRQGLPTTLYGYAPNTFAFTSADFSVATGRSLDPGGTLATAFLPGDIASRIDAVSSLGAVATLANDLSTKLIYLSPKLNGFQGGLSYASDVDEPAKRFVNLVQGRLLYESYRGRNVYRLGGSFNHADGRQPVLAQAGYRDLESVNLGASATFVDEWTVGAAVTDDGRSGLLDVPQATSAAPAWGVTVSLNYNSGPWTAGGYLQQVRSESDPLRPGSDLLQVLQIGISHRFNTKVRVFAASYFYRFDDEGRASAADRFRGTVLLAGLRLTL